MIEPGAPQPPATAARRSRLGRVIVIVIGVVCVVALAVVVALQVVQRPEAQRTSPEEPKAASSPTVPPPTFQAPKPTPSKPETTPTPSAPDDEKPPIPPAPQPKPTPKKPADDPESEKDERPPAPVVRFFKSVTPIPHNCMEPGYSVGHEQVPVSWDVSNAIADQVILLKGTSSDPNSLDIYTDGLPLRGITHVQVNCTAGSAISTYTLLAVDTYGRQATAVLKFDRVRG